MLQLHVLQTFKCHVTFCIHCNLLHKHEHTGKIYCFSTAKMSVTFHWRLMAIFLIEGKEVSRKGKLKWKMCKRISKKKKEIKDQNL